MSLLRAIRLWWEDRGWGADQRRCIKVLALAQGQPTPRAMVLEGGRVVRVQPCTLTEDRLRSGAAWVEAYTLQLEEIRSLPEIEPFDRWTP